MSQDKPKSLAELMARPGSAVARLADQAQAGMELAAALKAALPAELAESLLAANLRADGTLVVTASSPAWAGRLRFEGAVLLAVCRKRHPGAARVKVRASGEG